jgi:uncharacterized protein YukE
MSGLIKYDQGTMSTLDAEFAGHVQALGQHHADMNKTAGNLTGNAQGAWTETFSAKHSQLAKKFEDLHNAVHQLRTGAANSHQNIHAADNHVAKSFS